MHRLEPPCNCRADVVVHAVLLYKVRIRVAVDAEAEFVYVFFAYPADNKALLGMLGELNGLLEASAV